MIKVKAIENTDIDTNSYLVSLIADTREEVDNGGPIVGLPSTATLEFGSTVITTNFETAMLRSDGTWNWGDE